MSTQEPGDWPSLRPSKVHRPASLHYIYPHANLPSEACATTKRSCPAERESNTPMLRKSSPALPPSPLAPARYGDTPLEVDSQNHLQTVLSHSESGECNFETVRLMAARVPTRAPQLGTAEAMSPPQLTPPRRHCYSESSRSAATSNSRPLQFAAHRTNLTEEYAWPPQ